MHFDNLEKSVFLVFSPELSTKPIANYFLNASTLFVNVPPIAVFFRFHEANQLSVPKN